MKEIKCYQSHDGVLFLDKDKADAYELDLAKRVISESCAVDVTYFILGNNSKLGEAMDAIVRARQAYVLAPLTAEKAPS